MDRSRIASSLLNIIFHPLIFTTFILWRLIVNWIKNWKHTILLKSINQNKSFLCITISFYILGISLFPHSFTCSFRHRLGIRTNVHNYIQFQSGWLSMTHIHKHVIFLFLSISSSLYFIKIISAFVILFLNATKITWILSYSRSFLLDSMTTKSLIVPW